MNKNYLNILKMVKPYFTVGPIQDDRDYFAWLEEHCNGFWSVDIVPSQKLYYNWTELRDLMFYFSDECDATMFMMVYR
jgi:hypothetical protein